MANFIGRHRLLPILPARVYVAPYYGAAGYYRPYYGYSSNYWTPVCCYIPRGYVCGPGGVAALQRNKRFSSSRRVFRGKECERGRETEIRRDRKRRVWQFLISSLIGIIISVTWISWMTRMATSKWTGVLNKGSTQSLRSFSLTTMVCKAHPGPKMSIARTTEHRVRTPLFFSSSSSSSFGFGLKCLQSVPVSVLAW